MVDQFTDQEKNILKPFFTNMDKSIFALTNLPEVVKGALFSRYSRTAKSLRRVLLEEFINAPEMDFAEIVGISDGKGDKQIVATKKAEEFYDRVLVGYGDDSVAELGGASIACEDVSSLAADVLEDSRIGISPLEKSTRYVRFDDKVDGRFRYFRDPDIMNSNFADLYIQTNDFLFETYSKLIEEIMKFIMEKIPRDETTSERAYLSSIRAKACDVMRGMLPAATLTNLGLFGNGRSFEYLLTKMRAHPLTEVRVLSNSMHEELAKVIPSFVKRVFDKYGEQHQNYFSDTRSAMSEVVKNILGTNSFATLEPVRLVKFDPEAEIKVIAAMMYPHSHAPMEDLIEIVKKMSEEERKKIIFEYLHRRANRRHKPGRAWENVHYTFDFLGNYGMFRDFHRHRMLTQERQDLTTNHGFDTPKEIIEAGFQEKFVEAMTVAKNTFDQISKVFPKQAQYVVPRAYKIRWYFTLSLREACFLTELRSMQQGHPDYRKMAQQIFLKVKEVHPNLAEFIKFVDMNDYALERLEAEKKIDKKLEEIKTKGIANAG